MTSLGVAGFLAVMVIHGALPSTSRADDAPANPPTRSATALTKEQKVTKLLDYLEAEYVKKTTSLYWVTRAMGTISLARSPRPSAAVKLFEILEKDKHDVVRLLAWQGLLARCENMDSKSFVRLSAATLSMLKRTSSTAACERHC